ncbi:MAG: ABC transporter substrate-binding protein [Deltaproteobacteria bacterium]|nr:ABC transporter substrate-binding protein [Candidatus Tharpella sp.]
MLKHLRKMSVVLMMAMVMLVTTGSPILASKADDTLRFAWKKELETLDRYFNTAREGMIVSRLICDDLIYRDPVSNKYKPLLAKSWKWIDNTTIEFELRQGIVFHNGEKFDADDVVYTLNFVSNPDNKILVQRNVNWIKKAEKLGPYKVRVLFKKPFPAVLEYLAGNLPIYPNEYYAKVGPEGFGRQPVGTGPYKVVEVDPGKRIVFKKNADYFKASPKGQPAIGTLVQRTISEMTTQVAELMTGGLDWIYLVPTDQAEKLAKVPNIKVLKAETMRIGFLQMDANGRCGDTPFKKKEVRQAVCYAIDRDAICKNLVGGQSRVINSACYPGQFGCSQNVKTYEYNPVKAKKLLAEAGYPHGFETDFYGYRNRPYAEAMVGYLKGVGIKANLKYLKYSALREKTSANKTPFIFLTWGSYGINDISNITGSFFRFSKRDLTHDSQVRDWLEQGDTSIDRKVRLDVYHKALSKIADEAYWLPLFTWVANYAFSDELNFAAQPDAVPRFFLSTWK